MTKDSENQKLVPAIRFKGFTDDWEQRKLGDVVTRLKSYPLSRDVETTENSGYRYVHYGDIHTRVADVIDDEGVLPQINPGKYEPIQTGDLCLADASEDYQDIAAPSVLLAEHKDNVVAGLHTIALRPDDADPLFLYFLFKAPDFRHYVYREGQGLKVFGISARGVLNYTYAFPSMTEQAKIVKLLRSFDTTIALHQRKYENLQAVKKELLRRMFASDEKTVPDFRFKGYTNDWEQRKFFDVIQEIIDFRGRTPKKLGLDWSNSGYLALSALNVKNGFVDTRADPHYGDEVLYRKWMEGKELRKGQVLFTMEAPVGNVAQVPDNRGYILSQRTVALVPNSNIMTNDFLAELLSSPSVQVRINQLSTGGTAQGVSQRSLKLLSVRFPGSTKEQENVSRLVQSLSRTIVLHQRKLENLKKLKKVLLQKLFV